MSMTTTPRKSKRFLAAEQKYNLWVRMLTRHISQGDAAEVDRSVTQRMSPGGLQSRSADVAPSPR